MNGRTVLIILVAAVLGLSAAAALWHLRGRAGGSTSNLPMAQPLLRATGALNTPEPPLSAAHPVPASPSTSLEAEPLATEATADSGQNPISAQEAFEWLLAEAEAGSTAAMLNVAEFYGQGWGGRPNFTERFQWLKKAAEAGDPRGFFLAALALEMGLGVVADQAAARVALLKAADAGLPAAHLKLGQDLLAGPEADPAQAAVHLEEALAGGLPMAANDLGLLYLRGAGNLAPNAEKARQALQRGADLADPEALKNLAVMYKEGWGGPADPVQALKWYLAARQAGWESNFEEILAELEAQVGAEASRQAEAEARAWLAERKPRK